MIVVQVVIVLLAVIIAAFSLGNRRTTSGRAWKKLALLLLAVMMVVAAIFPDTTTYFAKLVGVGRGADLILYLTSLAFIFYVLNSYLHQQDERDIMYRIARRMAIDEANERYKVIKK